MEKTLVGHSVVIINTGINPSSFNSYWLVTNGILEEEELSNEHIFTNQVVEINGDNYGLTITGNSFQIRAKNEISDLDKCVNDKLEKIIDATSNTIYISAGVNFNWIVEPKGSDFKKLSRDLFFKADSDIFSFFDENDATFGSYMSKDFDDARLKLDIKPVYLNQDLINKKGAIHFNFNFHYDIPENDRSNKLKEFIKKWEVFYAEAKRIIDNLK
jgi:hypothetical protein